MTIILKPFSMLLLWLSTGLNSYALALVVFTIVLKVIFFPFNLKSKRSMIKTSALQSQVQRIQRQYAKNPQKMNEEISALYQREHASPMGGCVWTLIPLIILIAIYSVIREPMTYMMGLSAGEVDQVRTVLQTLGATFSDGAYVQLHMTESLSRLLPDVQAALPEIGSKLTALNFQFLGINVANIPSWKFWEGGISWNSVGLFLIPIVSAITGFFASRYSMKVSAMQNPEQANGANTAMMLVVSPLLSLFIGFSMPAALSVYWVANNVFTLLSEMLFSVILKKEYEQAAIDRAEREKREKEEEALRREQERAERARRIEEEKLARKNIAKRRAMKQKQKKEKSGASNEASRVGIRAYARGRAYDPYRFSPDGPTPYRDPAAVVDEEAIERAVEEKEVQAEVEAALRRSREENQSASATEQETPDTQVTEASADQVTEQETAAPAGEEEAPSAEFPKTLFDEEKEEDQ